MDCIFCKIAEKSIPADIVYEDQQVIAFRDLQPQAPQHILIIPKEHIATMNDLESPHQNMLGQMMMAAKQLAEELQLAEQGYRVVMNCNEGGGQAVFHIHLHLLGGRQMQWPPG